ncbi:MAG: hypothetical protein HZC11_07405 [Nitrospirae bacterium]|nr:hypothetical protein [Nitrospirota bacterium]
MNCRLQIADLKFKIANLKSQILNHKFIIVPLLLIIMLISGCELSIEKPSQEGKGPMKIEIAVDKEMAPESHKSNTTADGKALETAYAKLPVLGKIFKSSLKGIDYWRANHPYLITGTQKPALLADPSETCLDCHDENTSCNNCHKYVGVNQVSGK